MSAELMLRHAAAIRATVEQTRVSLELLSSQLTGLEAYAKVLRERETAPKARIEVPETCRGTDQADCARLNEDAAITVGGMSGEGRGCRGCGLTVTT